MKSAAVICGDGGDLVTEIAERLARDGWSVALLGEDGPELGEAETVLDSWDALVLACDLDDEEEIADIFDQVVDVHGPVGLLLLCLTAPVPWRPGDATHVLRHAMEETVLHAYALFQAARARMGDELNVVVLRHATAGNSTITDAAMDALATALASEEASKIRINTLVCQATDDLEAMADLIDLVTSRGAGGLSGQVLRVTTR